MKKKHSLMSAVLLTTLFAVCTPSFAFYWECRRRSQAISSIPKVTPSSRRRTTRTLTGARARRTWRCRETVRSLRRPTRQSSRPTPLGPPSPSTTTAAMASIHGQSVWQSRIAGDEQKPTNPRPGTDNRNRRNSMISSAFRNLVVR